MGPFSCDAPKRCPIERLAPAQFWTHGYHRADHGLALHGWTWPRDTRWVQLVRWLRAPARGKPLARWRDGVFVILRPPRSLASASARCSGDVVHLVKIGSRSSHLLTSQQ